MVAPNVPRFGFQQTLCLARPALLQALERYEQGDYIGAAVRLREAVKRFLVAAVEWYGVPVPEKRAKHARPLQLAKALRDAKKFGEWGYKCVEEMILTGNRGAHLGHIDRDCLRSGITVLFSLMDGEPYTMPELRSDMWLTADEANPYDIDDCDNTQRISRKTRRELERLREFCETYSIKNPGDTIFPPKKNGNYYYHLRRIFQKAGVSYAKRTGFHQIRRSHATALYVKGGDPTYSLGHESVKMTREHYLDPRYVRPFHSSDMLTGGIGFAVRRLFRRIRVALGIW